MAEPKNVRVLQQFRLNTKDRDEPTRVAVKGEVIAKSDFAKKSDWQNLLHMPKPRVEETDDKAGLPKATKAGAPAMPGA